MGDKISGSEKKDLPVGYKISYLLANAGMTQKELAKIVGVSVPMVGYVMWGQRTSKPLQKKIANTLGFGSWKELVKHKEIL